MSHAEGIEERLQTFSQLARLSARQSMQSNLFAVLGKGRAATDHNITLRAQPYFHRALDARVRLGLLKMGTANKNSRETLTRRFYEIFFSVCV